MTVDNPTPSFIMEAERLLAAERARQIGKHGWTALHDDTHTEGQLLAAGNCYYAAGADLGSEPPKTWPWDREFWQPRGLVRNLTRAGALYIAESERLVRARLPDEDVKRRITNVIVDLAAAIRREHESTKGYTPPPQSLAEPEGVTFVPPVVEREEVLAPQAPAEPAIPAVPVQTEEPAFLQVNWPVEAWMMSCGGVVPQPGDFFALKCVGVTQDPVMQGHVLRGQVGVRFNLVPLHPADARETDHAPSGTTLLSANEGEAGA